MNRKLLVFVILTAILPTAVRAQAPAVTAPVPEAAPAGFELRDFSRGVVIKTPNALWNINGGQFSIGLTHSTHFDAYISLRKSYSVFPSAAEAHDKKIEYLKSSTPGAVMLREKEAINVGAEPAMSFTYRDPGQLKIFREIVFNHNGASYELSFSVKEENFDKVKEDFSAILKGIQTF